VFAGKKREKLNFTNPAAGKASKKVGGGRGRLEEFPMI